MVKTDKSVQEIQNLSFDNTYNVSQTEPLVYNSETGNLDRMVQPSTSIAQASQIALENTLNSLIETLQELVSRLAPLAGAMSNTAQLRSVVTGTVTASGPITSAQSIAEKNIGGVSYGNRVSVDNNTAIQSNIINCIGK